MAHFRKAMISFFLTTSCNLNCSYCYTRKSMPTRRNQKLDLNFAMAGIDDFFSQNPSRHIRFYGPGEPTTEMELMKGIYNYAKAIACDSLTSEIQTNGVFDDEVLEWISNNLDIIWISCDGPADIQDTFRRTLGNKPTSNTIKNNISNLVLKGKAMTGVRSTITADAIERQIEIVDYFAALGIKYIWTDPVFPSVGEEYDEFYDFMRYAETFLVARDYAKKNGVFYGSFLACNFDEQTNYHCRACIPVPHLTTDGYVSACDMALFGNMMPSENHMNPFIIGKWNQVTRRIEYHADKINQLRLRSANNMVGCQKCKALKNCAGYCLGEVANESRDMFGKKAAVCNAIRYLYAHMKDSDCKYDYLHP